MTIMIPMKPDGEVDTARMVVLNQIATGVVPEDELGELTPGDIAYIKDVKITIAKAKAAGIENPMIYIPDF